MDGEICYLEEFLRKNKFVPQRNEVVGTAYGKAMRRDICFETFISFHEETKNYTVTGHGMGDYATLEEVAIAITLPKTKGGVRPNSGMKKIGGGQVKLSIYFTDDDQRKLQLAIDRRAVSFNAFVRRAALSAASENRSKIIEHEKPNKTSGGKSRSLSFSADERNNLQAVADRHSISFSTYVRNATLNAASNL